MADARKRPEEEELQEQQAGEISPREEERREILEEKESPISGLAIGGLALSVIALILPVLFAMVAGLVGATLGAVSLYQIRRHERTGSLIAWSAIIVGAIVAIFALLFFAGIFTGVLGVQSSMLSNFWSLRYAVR